MLGTASSEVNSRFAVPLAAEMIRHFSDAILHEHGSLEAWQGSVLLADRLVSCTQNC